MPNLIDIIIPTYNNSDYTIRCLRSIEKNTVVPYRIIWIDDGSMTPEYQKVSSELKEWGIDHVAYRTEENKGFAKAINIGIKISESDPIIFLNNDVVVTKGWLRRLIHGFGVNEKIGIIGAVTNKCGSNQQYGRLMRYLRRPIPKEPDKYFSSLEPERISINSNISYFCTAVSRVVINTIGLLDEEFLNGGEDDDYNDRARLAGFKTIIALDCFVWHEHEATRGKVLDQKTRKRNLDLYLKKRAERRV